jgi:hypothetical protein
MTESAHAAGSDSALLAALLSLLHYLGCTFFAPGLFQNSTSNRKIVPPSRSPDSCGAHTCRCWKTPTAVPQ